MVRCNCGAKHTRHSKDMHSDWCDVIQKTNTVVRNNFGRLEFKRVDESKIEVYLKDGKLHVADMDYRFSHGDFKAGVMNVTIHGQELRQAILQCVDYLQDAINDDRIDKWIPHRQQAVKKWKEQE